MQKLSEPLHLAGAKNIRDLGGYTTDTGAKTKTHEFLRGDTLSNLTKEDCQLLIDYGVGCVIDLRSQDEINRAPGRLHQLHNSIIYANIPLQDHVRASRYTSEFPPSMWQLYYWLLDDSGSSFHTIFKTIQRHKDSCILFHCAGGKDRTGLLAMLLLKLAGVDDETIIGDYSLSEKAMKDIFPLQAAEMESRGLTVPPYILKSPPEDMQRALEHLYANYHTVENYLLHVGLTLNEIGTIRKKIVD